VSILPHEAKAVLGYTTFSQTWLVEVSFDNMQRDEG